MKIFEVSDVAVQDSTEERQARNYRRLCAVYMDRKAGFEVAHGLLDRVMQILGVPLLERKENEGNYGYYIASANGERPLHELLICHALTLHRSYVPPWPGGSRFLPTQTYCPAF